MLFIAYVGICLKVHKNVLKCSLGDYLYPPATLLLYLRLRRRRLGTALHPPLELNPTQKAPFFMGLLVSEYKYACLIFTTPPGRPLRCLFPDGKRGWAKLFNLRFSFSF